MSKSQTPPAGDAADQAEKAMTKAEKAMTKAEAAKRVKRMVEVKGPDGKMAVKAQTIAEDEVLSFRDYCSHVVVVTIDGQKFSSAPAA